MPHPPVLTIKTPAEVPELKVPSSRARPSRLKYTRFGSHYDQNNVQQTRQQPAEKTDRPYAESGIYGLVDTLTELSNPDKAWENQCRRDRAKAAEEGQIAQRKLEATGTYTAYKPSATRLNVPAETRAEALPDTHYGQFQQVGQDIHIPVAQNPRSTRRGHTSVNETRAHTTSHPPAVGSQQRKR